MVASSDIVLNYTGGTGNTDPEQSLGGAIGGVVDGGASNNDMNDITSTEATDGIIIYRAYMYENTSSTTDDDFVDPKVWVSSQPNFNSGVGTDVYIGVSNQDKNIDMEVISDEETAPASVTFTLPTANGADALSIGTLAPDDYRGIWVRYTVTAGQTVAGQDMYTLAIQGDSSI